MPKKVISYTLLLLTFIFSTIDTHLFVYPSLSRSLITGLMVVFMGCFAFCEIVVRGKLVYNNFALFITSWIGYIILYSCFNTTETYRTNYLICSLVFCLVMTIILQSDTLATRDIGDIFLIVGGTQVLTVCLQFVGMVNTSREFRVTGLYDSPTPTALFLIGCCPVILNRLCFGNKKTFYSIFLCFMLLALLVLGCRTAWIGMLIMSVFYVTPVARCCLNGKKLRIKNKYAFFVIPFAFLLAFNIYNMKKASSDSRVFIWHRSLEMIADRPMGYGYGLFERNYNLWQGRYFASGIGTDEEKFNAEMTITPYNDFIEECVEGGVVGGLFYLTLFITAGFMAWRQKNRAALSIIVSFFFMSQTNYLYTSDSAWLLLMSVIGLVVSKDMQKYLTGEKMTFITSSIYILFLALAGIHEARTINAQKKLKCMVESIKEGEIVDEDILTGLRRDIGTSELYYTMSARNYLNAHEPARSLDAAKTAAMYTSKPEVYYIMANAEIMSGDINDAVSHLNFISAMQPHHLQPITFAMRILAAKGRTKDAVECAKKILSMPVKVKSVKAIQYKKEARSFLSIVCKNREL